MSNCTLGFRFRINLSVHFTSPFSAFRWPFQLEPFSSAATITPKTMSKIEIRRSLTAKYLINSFGFSQSRASTLSKSLNIESPEKPDSVVAFLNNQGFTENQIQILVTKCPYILVSDPQKTLLPKINFFRSSGISEHDLRNIFLRQPNIFKRSLHNQIAPSLKFMQKICDESGIRALSVERFAKLLNGGLQHPFLSNLEVLRDAGIPDPNILYLLEYHFRAAVVDTDSLRRVVNDVTNLGFNPSELKFVMAIGVFELMGKSTWEKKMAVYMNWGLSNDEIISAFVRHPKIMANSEHKIAAVMDLLVKKMGFDSSIILKSPLLLQRSLEKRLLPRCAVYKDLMDNGLIKKGFRFVSFIGCTEEVFINKFLQGYMKDLPGLLKLYRDELDKSKK